MTGLACPYCTTRCTAAEPAECCAEPIPNCEWYALCENVAVGDAHHPVLGSVPACERCADRHNLELETYA